MTSEVLIRKSLVRPWCCGQYGIHENGQVNALSLTTSCQTHGLEQVSISKSDYQPSSTIPALESLPKAHLKIVHHRCQVAGQVGEGVCVVWQQPRASDDHMHRLQHI